MYRGYLLLVFIGILALSYQLFREGGVRDLERLYAQKVAEKTLANEAVRRENAELRAEWESLQARKEAVEERARRDLFMVRPDEVLFRIETPDEVAMRDAKVAQMPDYSMVSRLPKGAPTFKATKSYLYWAPGTGGSARAARAKKTSSSNPRP